MTLARIRQRLILNLGVLEIIRKWEKEKEKEQLSLLSKVITYKLAKQKILFTSISTEMNDLAQKFVDKIYSGDIIFV